jgi:hypothetical protein
VVVITDSPQHFGAIKAQLGVVTAAWFAQRYAKSDVECPRTGKGHDHKSFPLIYA